MDGRPLCTVKNTLKTPCLISLSLDSAGKCNTGTVLPDSFRAARSLESCLVATVTD